MKKFFVLAAALLISLAEAAGIHYSRISGTVKDVGNVEIVMGKNIPVLKFAAKELQSLLKQATGKTFPIVSKPGGKAFSIILGDSALTRAAGINVEKLPEEGYVMLRKGNRLFIAGKDHLRNNPLSNGWTQAYDRNTLNAVYDFMERFAGAGFFFPGKHGCVVPRRKGLMLPAQLEIRESPDMKQRTFYFGQNGWFEKGTYSGGVRGYNMNCLIHRLSNSFYPFGHGLNCLQLTKRFGKSNPEYFALMPDGKRFNDPDMAFSGHICWNSKVKDVIIGDALAFFRGQPAKSRGIKNWSVIGCYGKYFSVMAQDWFYWCGCGVCKKIAEPGRGKIYKDMKHHQAVSDQVWQFTADVANAVKKAKLPGVITQMAYLPYDLIPKCDIPDNVKVMVAVTGQGGVTAKDKAETEKMALWVKKLKQPVMLWTYATGKHGKKNIPGIPPMLARNMGRFIDNNKKYVDGIFWEAETELAFLQYFNLYVASRKMWNTSLDTNKIIDRHHAIMFGKGAPQMKKFYDELEKLWLRLITNTVDTGLGPVTQIPGDLEIWTKLYSPAKIRQLNALIDAARRAAAADKSAVARIEFVRTHLLGPLKAQCDKFNSFQNALDSWNISVPGRAYLRACKGEKNEVSTKVTLSEDKGNFIFRFDCEEPRMKDLKCLQTKRDAKLLFADSSVEVMLNPSGDRKNYYQFIVNANGVIADYQLVKGGKSRGIAWNSSATAKAERKADSWSVTVTIPKKDLGKYGKKIPANFARHRALNGKAPKEIYYQWSPLSGGRAGFHEIERWGAISFEKCNKTMLLNENFEFKLPRRCWRNAGAKGGQIIALDKRVFISGGNSVYMKNVPGKLASFGYELPAMKPSTRYRLSFFIKTANLKGKGGAGTYIYFNQKDGRPMPSNRITGTKNWHRLSFEFKTPGTTGKDRKPIIGFWIWYAGGEAWYDEIKLEELK